MTGVLEFLKDFLRTIGHDHIFCSVLQFGVWYKKLTKDLEEVEALGEAYGEDVIPEEEEVLEVDSVPLYYALGPRNYQQVPWTRRLAYTVQVCGRWPFFCEGSGRRFLSWLKKDLTMQQESSQVSTRDDQIG